MTGLRKPGPRTLIPDEVRLRRTGEVVKIKGDAVMTALVVAIAEDFMVPMQASGWNDVVSAAADAAATMRILAAAGLMAVPVTVTDID